MLEYKKPVCFSQIPCKTINSYSWNIEKKIWTPSFKIIFIEKKMGEKDAPIDN